MKNKAAKEMMTTTTLKGRKVFWFGEETEIFVAKSLQQLVDEFGLPDEDEALAEQGGKVRLSYLWKKGYNEEGSSTEPVINWVYGDTDTICQLSSSYN